jgi:hypothetical protein
MHSSEGLSLRYLGTLFLATLCGFALAVSAALAQEQGAKDLYVRVDKIVRETGTKVTFEFQVQTEKDQWTTKTIEGLEATINGVRVTTTDSFVLLRFADKEVQKDAKGNPRDITIYMSDYGRDGFVDRTVQVALTADQISAENDESMEDDCASPEWENSMDMRDVLSVSAMALGTSNTAIAGKMSPEREIFLRREIRYVNHGDVLMLRPPKDTKRFTAPEEMLTPGDAPIQQAKFRAKLEGLFSK